MNSPSQGKPQCSPHYEDDDDHGQGTFQGSPIFHLGGKSLGFGIAGRWLLEWLALNFNLIHKLLHCLGTIPDHGLPPIACISSCISTYNSLRIWKTIHFTYCMYFNVYFNTYFILYLENNTSLTLLHDLDHCSVPPLLPGLLLGSSERARGGISGCH